ncbi:recombinase RecT [Nocardia vinacea]|uniref:Recombinase RecT n=1 Tax=Nocardia vinacea TaxID=96468 RepID=A0ABZ1YIS3_9NOCA|nr:RecT family recombinase [Nocardia vinacea]
MSESIAGAAEAAKSTPGSVLRRRSEDFATVLPPTVDLRRWLRLAESAVTTHPDLMTIFERDRGSSMLRALMKCAQLGHEPGSGSFHLVPKGQAIEGWEDYKGIIQRILRSGLYSRVVLEAVYEQDRYEFNSNRDERPLHEPADGDRGKPVRAYAYAVHFNGAISSVAEATPEMIAAAKAKGRGTDSDRSPWQSPAAPMQRKVAVRALEKMVSTSSVDLRVLGGASTDSMEDQ